MMCFQDVFGTELSQKRAIEITTREALRKKGKRLQTVTAFRFRFSIEILRSTDAHEFSKIISAY